MTEFYKWSIVIIGIIATVAGMPQLGIPFALLGLFIIVAIRPVDEAFEQATEDENPAGQLGAMAMGGLVFLVAIAAFFIIVGTVL